MQLMYKQKKKIANKHTRAAIQSPPSDLQRLDYIYQKLEINILLVHQHNGLQPSFAFGWMSLATLLSLS